MRSRTGDDVDTAARSKRKARRAGIMDGSRPIGAGQDEEEER